jgi:hypothetical protein
MRRQKKIEAITFTALSLRKKTGFSGLVFVQMKSSLSLPKMRIFQMLMNKDFELINILNTLINAPI